MAEICKLCGVAHQPGPEMLAGPEPEAENIQMMIGDDHAAQTFLICSTAQGIAIERLLRNVAGEPVKCRGCEALIYWVTHKNGKRAPYTAAALNHFINCPAAAQFGKGRA